MKTTAEILAAFLGVVPEDVDILNGPGFDAVHNVKQFATPFLVLTPGETESNRSFRAAINWQQIGTDASGAYSIYRYAGLK